MDQLNINQKAKLFNEIFAGCETGRGVCNYDKQLKKKNNVHWQYQKFDPVAHLNGTLTQGRSPVIESKGAVRWISWDIDEEIDVKKFCGDIWLFDNLIFPFKSLGGRWHLYKWFSEDYDPNKANKYAKVVEKKLIEKGYKVDTKHTLPTAFNLKEKKPGYWFFNPYSQEINICYSPLGNSLTFQQFAFRFKHRHHPLISASVGLQDLTKIKLPQHRHSALWQVGLYLKYNKVDTTVEEVNDYFTDPITDNAVKHAKKNENYDQEHLNKNISNYLTDMTGVEHEWKRKEEDPPDDMWKNNQQYEDFAFNDGPGATENEPGQTEQIELVGYDMKIYRGLDIPPKKFIIENFLFDKSFNFIVGPKGTGKSEFVIGMCCAITRGITFLGRTVPNPTPVVYVDAEMYPTDPIDREDPYVDRWDEHPDNYFHMLNFSFQDKQQFPDLQTEGMQQGLRNYLKKIEKLTGKKPLLVLDNLRSLSAYKENDSDAWYPMGKFLFKLRGLGYPSIVIDHMGKMSPGPRGSSSKTDWADLVLVLTPEKEKGHKNMKVKVVFDKARGLRPENTDEFFAEYNFRGEWTVAEGKAELDQEETFIEIDKIIREWTNGRMKLYPILKPIEEMDLKRSGKLKAYYQNRFPRGVKCPTQQYVADKIGCSVGKMNSLMKKFDKWKEDGEANGGQGKDVPF